ncbi:hypothetical protein BU25DRAFT_422152 [Macroventuria anomochaeta]|uniref:Uncharacterized protein n=1 Tax=Macroventuria anomochaeta TaxID=301207 RepID=A0ACB6RY53_9PLEO|nr:uncharacterized protein BU25DRAFT_422152 [Macroventuria anomochaeta]KAF2626806.1 hypothetical protein BU25DRAFT_422152 [Macroventuria anomochaeta]
MAPIILLLSTSSLVLSSLLSTTPAGLTTKRQTNYISRMTFKPPASTSAAGSNKKPSSTRPFVPKIAPIQPKNGPAALVWAANVASSSGAATQRSSSPLTSTSSPAAALMCSASPTTYAAWVKVPGSQLYSGNQAQSSRWTQSSALDLKSMFTGMAGSKAGKGAAKIPEQDDTNRNSIRTSYSIVWTLDGETNLVANRTLGDLIEGLSRNQTLSMLHSKRLCIWMSYPWDILSDRLPSQSRSRGPSSNLLNHSRDVLMY